MSLLDDYVRYEDIKSVNLWGHKYVTHENMISREQLICINGTVDCIQYKPSIMKCLIQKHSEIIGFSLEVFINSIIIIII